MMRTFDGIWYDEETGKLGISKEKAEEIKEVSYIDLPEEGAAFKEDDVVITIEGMKNNFEVRAPFDLKVTKINPELEESPESLTDDPDNIWIIEATIEG